MSNGTQTYFVQSLMAGLSSHHMKLILTEESITIWKNYTDYDCNGMTSKEKILIMEKGNQWVINLIIL